MNNPFFHPRQLSEEQLLEKMHDLENRLFQARQNGYTHETITQLQNMLDQCREVYNEENMTKLYQEEEGKEQSSIVIGEDDPREKKEKEQEETKKSRRKRER